MRFFRAPAVIGILIGFLSIGLEHIAGAQPAPAATSALSTPDPEYFGGYGASIFVVSFVLIAAAITVGAAILLYKAAQKPNDPYIVKLRASFFFWLGMGYTLLLLLLAIAYNVFYHSKQPYLIADMLPIGVPWFGAVGAVTISLEGVFQWNQSHWDPKYNYWHIGRPIFGAVLGIVAFFLFVLILISAGSAPPFLANPEHAPAAMDFIIYYVVAFLVGYREETFRELIRRVTDMILKPGATRAGDTDTPQLTFKIGGVAVPQIKFPGTPAGSSSHQTIEILNTGKAPLVAPKVTISASSSGGVFGLENDRVTVLKELGPSSAETVGVTFAPSNAGRYSATLIVAATNLAAPAAIPISGAT
jgi:hypothetical protein